MNRTEDMIVDHDMVVTQFLCCLRKRLDRSGIAAELYLRINHTSFHRALLEGRKVKCRLRIGRIRCGWTSPNSGMASPEQQLHRPSGGHPADDRRVVAGVRRLQRGGLSRQPHTVGNLAVPIA
jgi:hypothetical protein